MALIHFTANHEDLSTHRGYQFKLICDECGGGYVTRHQVGSTGIAGMVLGFLDFFGWGRWFSAWWLAAEDLDHGRLGKAHNDAFAKAVQECKAHFRQCRRCEQWVCLENCWIEEVQQCGGCAPAFRRKLPVWTLDPLTAAAGEQAQAKEQLGTDITAGSSAEGGTAAVAGGTCSECGEARLAVPYATQQATCASCGAGAGFLVSPPCFRPVAVRSATRFPPP